MHLACCLRCLLCFWMPILAILLQRKHQVIIHRASRVCGVWCVFVSPSLQCCYKENIRWDESDALCSDAFGFDALYCCKIVARWVYKTHACECDDSDGLLVIVRWACQKQGNTPLRNVRCQQSIQCENQATFKIVIAHSVVACSPGQKTVLKGVSTNRVKGCFNKPC